MTSNEIWIESGVLLVWQRLDRDPLSVISVSAWLLHLWVRAWPGSLNCHSDSSNRTPWDDIDDPKKQKQRQVTVIVGSTKPNTCTDVPYTFPRSVEECTSAGNIENKWMLIICSTFNEWHPLCFTHDQLPVGFFQCDHEFGQHQLV